MFYYLYYILYLFLGFFYASKGLIVANSEYDIFTALVKYVSDQSDWGGLAFTALGYILGGEEYGPFFSALLKILLYSWACVLIYKLFDTIFENKEWIKIILGLVAFNSYVPYFATAGLKELVFAFVVVGAVYYFYSVLRNPSLVNFLLFALFAISTFFFRAIFPIYFVAAHILFVKQLNYIKKILAVAHIVAAAFFTVLQSVFFPFFILNRQQQHTTVNSRKRLHNHSFIFYFYICFKTGYLQNSHKYLSGMAVIQA